LIAVGDYREVVRQALDSHAEGEQRLSQPGDLGQFVAAVRAAWDESSFSATTRFPAVGSEAGAARRTRPGNIVGRHDKKGVWRALSTPQRRLQGRRSQ
jgi:hypothetical protein